MKKILLIVLLISYSTGSARAQTDLRIGELNNISQRERYNSENDPIKSINSLQDEVSLEQAIVPENYILGPGDELALNIIMGENLTLPIKVTPTGDIFIPSVGLVNVSDESLDNARIKIKQFIIQNAYPNAKVSIALLNVRKFRIQVVGAVSKPGFIEVTAVDRLGSIIEKAEGFHPLAKEYDIFIKRKNGYNEKINFLKYIRDGSLIDNPTFLEGDIITVPFGSVKSHSVSLRGQVKNAGYDIIEPGETLLQFLNRNIDLSNVSTLQSIIISRIENSDNKIIKVLPEQFSKFILKNEDIIDIAREDGIMVNGFVQKPGAYNYIPGYSAYNYISMAGGNSKDGSTKNIKIYHKDGKISNKLSTVLTRGDVIIVERSSINSLVGNMSFLQIIASILTIYMTYLSSAG